MDFLNSQIWNEIMLELNGKKPSSVTTFSTDFSFQNLVILGIYLNFQRQKPLKNQYLTYCESKSYQINSIKSCSFRNFQLQFNSIFSQEIVQYSRTFQPQVQTSWNQAHAPLLAQCRAFHNTKNTMWDVPVRWIS